MLKSHHTVKCMLSLRFSASTVLVLSGVLMCNPGVNVQLFICMYVVGEWSGRHVYVSVDLIWWGNCYSLPKYKPTM